MGSENAKNETMPDGPVWVNVHPSYGVRGGMVEGGEVPAVGLTRWVEMSDDEQCALEIWFAASIIRWLITARPASALVFRVDMTDVDEREGLLASAHKAGVEVNHEAAGTLSGSVVPEIADAVVTCTQSVLSVMADDHVVCEVVDYLDEMRICVTRDELILLGDAMRGADIFP
jgi:hypothetical protein